MNSTIQKETLEERLERIKKQNLELKRKHEKQQEDIKFAQQQGALFKSKVSDDDWPRTSFGGNTPVKRNSDHNERASVFSRIQLPKSDDVKNTRLTNGPPPDPKSYLADNERDYNGGERMERTPKSSNRRFEGGERNSNKGRADAIKRNTPDSQWKDSRRNEDRLEKQKISNEKWKRELDVEKHENETRKDNLKQSPQSSSGTIRRPRTSAINLATPLRRTILNDIAVKSPEAPKVNEVDELLERMSIVVAEDVQEAAAPSFTTHESLKQQIYNTANLKRHIDNTTHLTNQFEPSTNFPQPVVNSGNPVGHIDYTENLTRQFHITENLQGHQDLKGHEFSEQPVLSEAPNQNYYSSLSRVHQIPPCETFTSLAKADSFSLPPDHVYNGDTHLYQRPPPNHFLSAQLKFQKPSQHEHVPHRYSSSQVGASVYPEQDSHHYQGSLLEEHTPLQSQIQENTAKFTTLRDSSYHAYDSAATAQTAEYSNSFETQNVSPVNSHTSASALYESNPSTKKLRPITSVPVVSQNSGPDPHMSSSHVLGDQYQSDSSHKVSSNVILPDIDFSQPPPNYGTARKQEFAPQSLTSETAVSEYSFSDHQPRQTPAKELPLETYEPEYNSQSVSESTSQYYSSSRSWGASSSMYTKEGTSSSVDQTNHTHRSHPSPDYSSYNSRGSAYKETGAQTQIDYHDTAAFNTDSFSNTTETDPFSITPNPNLIFYVDPKTNPTYGASAHTALPSHASDLSKSPGYQEGTTHYKTPDSQFNSFYQSQSSVDQLPSFSVTSIPSTASSGTRYSAQSRLQKIQQERSNSTFYPNENISSSQVYSTHSSQEKSSIQEKPKKTFKSLKSVIQRNQEELQEYNAVSEELLSREAEEQLKYQQQYQQQQIDRQELLQQQRDQEYKQQLQQEEYAQQQQRQQVLEEQERQRNQEEYRRQQEQLKREEEEALQEQEMWLKKLEEQEAKLEREEEALQREKKRQEELEMQKVADEVVKKKGKEPEHKCDSNEPQRGKNEFTRNFKHRNTTLNKNFSHSQKFKCNSNSKPFEPSTVDRRSKFNVRPQDYDSFYNNSPRQPLFHPRFKHPVPLHSPSSKFHNDVQKPFRTEFHPGNQAGRHFSPMIYMNVRQPFVEQDFSIDMNFKDFSNLPLTQGIQRHRRTYGARNDTTHLYPRNPRNNLDGYNKTNKQGKNYNHKNKGETHNLIQGVEQNPKNKAKPTPKPNPDAKVKKSPVKKKAASNKTKPIEEKHMDIPQKISAAVSNTEPVIPPESVGVKEELVKASEVKQETLELKVEKTKEEKKGEAKSKEQDEVEEVVEGDDDDDGDWEDLSDEEDKKKNKQRYGYGYGYGSYSRRARY